MLRAVCRKKLDSFVLDAEMEDGGMIFLTGPNGSGKTTFLMCLAGHYSMDGGVIEHNGIGMTGRAPSYRKFVYIDHSSVFMHMSVDKHLRWAMGTGDEVLLEKVKEGLHIDFHGKLRDLSLGQRTRVAVATAVLSGPNAILLDEVVSSITDRLGFLAELKELSVSRGFDVIYVTQERNDGIAADHQYVMEKGRLSRIA
jgi:ABC-type sugar transport system ATPase subunit